MARAIDISRYINCTLRKFFELDIHGYFLIIFSFLVFLHLADNNSHIGFFVWGTRTHTHIKLRGNKLYINDQIPQTFFR